MGHKTYVFEGNKMIEIDGDGNQRVLESLYPRVEGRPYNPDPGNWHPRNGPYNSGSGYTHYDKWNQARREEHQTKTERYTLYNVRPWHNVDFHKWPRTWAFLVRSYFAKDYHEGTKYVSDEEYNSRQPQPVTNPTSDNTVTRWEEYCT